jgi:hypothetical protein
MTTDETTGKTTDETTGKTTGETTSHLAMPPKNGSKSLVSFAWLID